MRMRDISLAIMVMAVWGASFSVGKVGLEEIPPLFFIALRFFIVAVPAVFFVPFPKTSVWHVIAVGICIGIIKFGLVFVALKEDADAGIASLVLQSQVFFTIALSCLLFGERPATHQLLGIVLATAGFCLFALAAGTSITLAGLVMIIGAGLSWAVANLVIKKTENVNLLHFMIWVSLIPPLPLLIISGLTETPDVIGTLTTLSFNSWLTIFYMGYLSTLWAYAVWGSLLVRYPSAEVAPYALLIPLFGILVAAIWLKERMTALEVAGAVIVLSGLLLSYLGKPVVRGMRQTLTRAQVARHPVNRCDNSAK